MSVSTEENSSFLILLSTLQNWGKRKLITIHIIIHIMYMLVNMKLKKNLC